MIEMRKLKIDMFKVFFSPKISVRKKFDDKTSEEFIFGHFLSQVESIHNC